MTEVKPPVAPEGVFFKGIREGLLIVLPEQLSWTEAMQQLADKLESAKDFWVGADTMVDVGEAELEEAQLRRLQEMLNKRYHLQLTVVYGDHEQTQQAAHACDLQVRSASTRRGQPRGSSESEERQGNALYIKQTIRSGQLIRYDGNVIICGDANPGSHIIAAGDIVVLGTLRGVAHAGAKGDETAQIMAVNLRPTQLRIAGHIARSPDQAEVAPPLTYMPEFAQVRNGKMHISPLKDRHLE